MNSILLYLSCTLIYLVINSNSVICQTEENTLVFTVATEPTDGYERFARSAKQYGIEFKALGMGKEWLGGDMQSMGGGFKINLLKEALKPYKSDNERIILVTDSYDVIFVSSLKEIVDKFLKTGAKIVFSAEKFCWPNDSLRTKYPIVTPTESRFLNSGMFMGYASDIYEMLKTPVKNTDDDQLFYTNAFLNEEFRNQHNFVLDHKSEIFQNLHGALADVKLEFDTVGKSFVVNKNFDTKPSVIHGNGLSKVELNEFGNYLADSFVNGVCHLCNENKIELKESELPVVSLAIFIEQPMPFFEEFLDSVLSLDYPKHKLNLFIHNNVKFHEELAKTFITKFGNEYKSVKSVSVDDSINESKARDLAVKQSELKESDYLFVVDSDVRLDNPKVLKTLMEYNKSFIAPMLTRPGEVWSNFWGALSENGFYARSIDYMDIVKQDIKGMWNVPYVSSCYLVKKSAFTKMIYKHETLDPDMAFCQNLRKENIFMYVINMEHYGHLVNGENFNTKLTRPDFYELLTNQADWEQRYIHSDYIKQLDPNATAIQPCTDVYWFAIASEQFCDDLVAIVEGFGKWSDGSNKDNRLEGGYEAVPTRDIHMNQVGLEEIWLKFLYLYVRPLQEKVFLGYYHDPPRSLMNFVVRYRPDEQPSLRPHHDSSTYTINIALNNAGIDYDGGGCRFLRYNCSVKDTKKGWMLMHPGRLTHFHEGLITNSGTRYIMISFVDP